MPNLHDLVEDLKRRGGYWTPALDPLFEIAPDFAEAYVAFAAHPCRSQHLTPKVKNFVGLAVHASATHLYEPGIRFYLKGALDVGASVEEIIEVLELTCNLGVHACVFGVPILVNEIGGLEAAKADADGVDREKLKAEFIAKRGYWSSIWDGLLALDPKYFQIFTAFSSAAWRSKALEPKVKEFMYIAANVSATHQFAPGTPIHIKNALNYGATAGEILEVIQSASVIGINTFEIALPILFEEIKSRK
jgi:alkylhydroperoxidase/carboxymuconolactone decarboxylase family protein YurZ